MEETAQSRPSPPRRLEQQHAETTPCAICVFPIGIRLGPVISINQDESSDVHLTQSQVDSLCEPCAVRRAAVLEYSTHLPHGEYALAYSYGDNGMWLDTRYSSDPGFLGCHHILELSCSSRDRFKASPGFNMLPLLSGNTSDQGTLHWIQDRLATCKEHHPSCGSADSEDVDHYPRYLVHLGDVDIKNPSASRIRIVEAKQRVRYVCLSYCWGPTTTNRLTLNKGNLQDLLLGMDWGSLPLAFQDAIMLLAKLNYSYIWIDALCIIQDDARQKQSQIERMGAIYSNCDFVVANLHAKSPDEGLFCSSERDRAVGYPVAALSGFDSMITVRNPLVHPLYETNGQDQVTFLPLMTRAWTFQELVLAPRVLFFNRWEVLWECSEMKTCQCESPSLPQIPRKIFSGFWFWSPEEDGMDLLDDGKDLVKRMLHRPVPGADMIRFWNRIVKSYAGRKITYDIDRYDAFLGIAKRVAAKLGGSLVVGMLMQRLHYCLMWSTDRPATKPSCALWPSWSWLSVVGGDGAEINSAFIGGESQPCEDSRITPVLDAGRSVLHVDAALYHLRVEDSESFATRIALEDLMSNNAPLSDSGEPLCDKEAVLTEEARQYEEDLQELERRNKQYLRRFICIGQVMSNDRQTFASGEPLIGGLALLTWYDLRWDDPDSSHEDVYCMALSLNSMRDYVFLLLEPTGGTLKEFRRSGILSARNLEIRDVNSNPMEFTLI